MIEGNTKFLSHENIYDPMSFCPMCYGEGEDTGYNIDNRGDSVGKGPGGETYRMKSCRCTDCGFRWDTAYKVFQISADLEDWNWSRDWMKENIGTEGVL